MNGYIYDYCITSGRRDASLQFNLRILRGYLRAKELWKKSIL